MGHREGTRRGHKERVGGGGDAGPESGGHAAGCCFKPLMFRVTCYIEKANQYIPFGI